MANKTKWIIGLLVLAVVILGGIVIYGYAVAPALTGYVADKQTEGYQFAIASLMQTAINNPCQPVPLQFGNQTVYLVNVECPALGINMDQTETVEQETLTSE